MKVKGDHALKNSDAQGEHSGTENERGEKAYYYYNDLQASGAEGKHDGTKDEKGENARMNQWFSHAATKTNSRHWWEERKANEEIMVIEDFQEGSMADKVFSTNVLGL